MRLIFVYGSDGCNLLGRPMWETGLCDHCKNNRQCPSCHKFQTISAFTQASSKCILCVKRDRQARTPHTRTSLGSVFVSQSIPAATSGDTSAPSTSTGDPEPVVLMEPDVYLSSQLGVIRERLEEALAINGCVDITIKIPLCVLSFVKT